jgi:monomeric phenylalanine-4-hydroxylase
MKSMIVAQDYSSYSAEDHNTWSILSERQAQLRKGKVSKEYLQGYNSLEFDRDHIISIPATSERLDQVNGWKLIPVAGLLPAKDFFEMLINRNYPITIYMRKPWEIDFSEQPDIFHDVFGHIPLLANEKFTEFLLAYSKIAIRYSGVQKAVDILARLYWYTYETGIIREDGEYKPYGGAIITSAGEMENSRNELVQKHLFDLDQILSTPYNSFKLQKEYFVIDSFDDLFSCLEVLEKCLVEHLLTPSEEGLLRSYSLNMPLTEMTM